LMGLHRKVSRQVAAGQCDTVLYDFQGQSFHKLRRACLHRGALFKDPLFPATDQSLFYKRQPPPGLTWKRPREICKDPRLFVDGISTRDLHQGSLGNCWMVAAISCLASEPSLWKKVWCRPDLYAGIFHFRFWRLGRWMDVVVDDRLPVSEDGVLLFCRSATPREFWSALLEKAYAKLNGCYEALEGGNTAEALIDFTGGVSEPLKKLEKKWVKIISLFHISQPAEGETVESVLECGLVRGHAYGITAVRKVRLGEKVLKTGGTSRLFMVRMRNPWGTTDWTGAWSQSHKKKYFTPSSSSAGGGEPLQSGAVRGGAGGQLHLHGFPKCDTEGNSDTGTLCCAAHHLPTGRHWTLPASPLLPLSYQTQVKCWSGKKG
uniref:Si:dkey-19b23.13 n=1 Tax=Neolamprologus brichardi TaxID=32507 RepID=A0A3Q4HWP7_NEOBR